MSARLRLAGICLAFALVLVDALLLTVWRRQGTQLASLDAAVARQTDSLNNLRRAADGLGATITILQNRMYYQAARKRLLTLNIGGIIQCDPTELQRPEPIPKTVVALLESPTYWWFRGDEDNSTPDARRSKLLDAMIKVTVRWVRERPESSYGAFAELAKSMGSNAFLGGSVFLNLGPSIQRWKPAEQATDHEVALSHAYMVERDVVFYECLVQTGVLQRE